MKVYFISGLGADKRVFKHIMLPEGFETVHLDWIPPVKRESLETYALRLAEKIDTKEKFFLLGLSMGGMIALEISKKHTPAATILLSSVPTCKAMPGHFRIAHLLRLHKLIPVRLLKSTTVIKHLFTIGASPDRLLLRQVIQDSDPVFIKWGIGAILEWKNETIPQNTWHIHGTKDEVLPVKYTKPTHLIEKGTHMMVMTKAGEINMLLKELLNPVINQPA